MHEHPFRLERVCKCFDHIGETRPPYLLPEQSSIDLRSNLTNYLQQQLNKRIVFTDRLLFAEAIRKDEFQADTNFCGKTKR